MSVTVTDEVDVIRYILLTNMLASNIQINSLDCNLLIKNRHTLPVIQWNLARPVFVRTFGGSGTIENADLFYCFENQETPVGIIINTLDRASVISAREEVKRAIYKARKVKDFDDSGVNDTAIKARYDQIYIQNIEDASLDQDGNYLITINIIIKRIAAEIITT